MNTLPFPIAVEYLTLPYGSCTFLGGLISYPTFSCSRRVSFSLCPQLQYYRQTTLQLTSTANLYFWKPHVWHPWWDGVSFLPVPLFQNGWSLVVSAKNVDPIRQNCAPKLAEADKVMTASRPIVQREHVVNGFLQPLISGSQQVITFVTMHRFESVRLQWAVPLCHPTLYPYNVLRTSRRQACQPKPPIPI